MPRHDAAAIARRLQRSPPLPCEAHTIDNTGPIGLGGDALVALIGRHLGKPAPV